MRKRWRRFIDWLTGRQPPRKEPEGIRAARDWVIEKTPELIEKEIERQERDFQQKAIQTSTLLKGAAIVLTSFALGAGLSYVVGRGALVALGALLSASPALAEAEPSQGDTKRQSPRTKDKLARPGQATQKRGPYGVYVGKGYVFVGTKKDIAGRRCSQTPGWGLKGTVGERIGGESGLKLLSPREFRSRNDALTWLRENITERSRVRLVSANHRAKINGAWYNVTPSLGRL